MWFKTFRSDQRAVRITIQRWSHNAMDQPRAAKAAKLTPEVPLASMSNMSNMAVRHMLRFVPAHTLANVECVTPRLGPPK